MEDLINNFLIEIKKNKKYSSISDEIIVGEIKNYINKNKIKDTNNVTKGDIKEIRNRLHKSYASFQTKKKNKINIYLEELKKDLSNPAITNKLLSIALSTKERINDYSSIYNLIFEITGKPKSIIDLGAGFNIFSFPLMNLPSLTYYSYDLNKEDINHINNYISIMKNKGLTGNANILDVRNKKQISNLPSSDILFMFKLLDIIDKENHKPSEELLTNLFKNKKAKFIVASFATKTLTRKKMNHPHRKWFELMLERNNLKFKKIKTYNEIFYIIII